MLGVTNAIINNLLNNVFHAIWLYLLAVEPKYTKRKRILFCGLSVVVAEALSLFTIFDFGVEGKAFTLLYIVGSLVYAVLYIFLLQGGKKLKACFIFFSYICVWAAVYVVAMVLFNHVFRGWEPSIWIVRSVCNIALLFLYQFFIKAKIIKSGAAMEKASGMLVAVSGMAYLLLPILMLVYAFREQTTWSLLVTIFLLLFSLVVYWLLFRFIRQIERESELRGIELQNKVLTETVHNFEAAEQDARRIRHDQRHHDQMLLEYMKSGDTQAAISYLSQYDRQKQEDAPENFCANRTVNNILRVYLRKARQKGIAITTNIAMGETTAVADADLVAILGNMLENAINGCMTAEGARSMEVSIRHQDIKLVLQCRNTCAGNVPFENGLPVRKGGVGVSSILASAEHYGGDVVFSEEGGVFTCAVLLNDMR